MWWRKKRQPAFERPLVEALLPRIMYAADLGAGLMAAAAGELADAIEMRVLDAGGDYVVQAATQDTLIVAVPPAGNASAGAAQQVSLPLNFEINRGQANSSVDFIARGNGVGIALADGNATLVLKNGTHSDVLHMRLAGAAAAVQGQAEGEVSARSNYLTGSPDQWLTDVANHTAVRYDGVYDGIDLRYYGNGRALEYDFIVAAGADWRAIALEFDGVDRVGIDPDGALRLTIDGPAGPTSLHFAAPVSYQTGADGRESVASRYVIGADGRVRFDIGAYDAGRTLVIDPLLVYGSYLGGSGLDRAQGIAVDAAGNTYITGETASIAFPTTAGGFDTMQNGGSDVFVTKLNAAGTALIYSTFIGGSGNDLAWGIALDAAGNAYVTGSTTSANLPTVGALQSALSGTQDAFLFKLNAGGSALSYSTYFGGSGSADVGYGVALDGGGNAYVVGATDSASGIASAGAFDTTLGGALDAFVAKFDATQSGAASRVFASYLGGSGEDHGYAVAVNAGGQAFVSGYTAANNFPTTANAYDSTANGANDIFLSVFNAAGSALAYSTYLGGSGTESARAITLDGSGTAYLGGTSSGAFPTKNTYDATYGGGTTDAVVAKLDTALSGAASLVYSTYVGGAGNDTASGIAVDSLGRAHLAGYTSGAFPTTADALQASHAGGANDAFYATLGLTGASLLYATYVGGSGDDMGVAITRDADHNLYLAGFTTSTDLQQITAGAVDTTHNGGSDAFVMKFTSQTLTVTTTNDVVDGSTSSIAALLANQGADGLISLREAIIATNNSAGADSIALAAGTYTLTRSGANEDAASTGDLDIAGDLVITGAGAASTIIDGNALDRVFQVHPGVSATLSDISIRGGAIGAVNYGGGVYVDSGASLKLSRAIVTANSAGAGAGLYNDGTLTASDTTFSNNAADERGGGLYNSGGVMLLERVAISGNTAGKNGAGIYNGGGGATLSLTNVTLSGNTAVGDGGGIYTIQAIAVTNSTIVRNASAAGTAGIHVQGGGSATLKNTILYNPGATNSNAALISAGNNLDSDGSAGLAAGGDLRGTLGSPINPNLGSLQNNGGSTLTHALLAGSIALNAGSASGAPTTDARGAARLGATDIGAYESTLVGYEPFAYPAGSFNAANGGSGWVAGWSSVGSDTAVAATGLQSPAVNMPVSGGTAQLTIPSILGSVTQTRDLSTSLGTAATTSWLSFLLQPASTALGDYIGLQFGSPSATRGFAGIIGSQFVLAQSGGGGRVVVSGIAADPFQTYLLTVKMDFTAAADSVTLYVNPPPGLAGPGAAFTASKNDLDLGTFTQIDIAGGRMLASNNAALDEIRVAGSYFDVAPASASTQRAPLLDATRSPTLGAQNEDAGAPVGAVGTLVSSLVDFAGGGGLDNVTDADSGALTGIAVTAADTSNGSWWTSVNGGNTWNALGAVADSNARMLAADALTRLYFQPNANYHGTQGSALTLRAWDQTSGSNGALASTSSNGGSTAFSSTTDSASLTITAINDAPAGTDTTVTTDEDTAYTLTAANFGFSDAADSPANALLAVRLSTLPGAGTLTNNGAAVSAGQSVTAADIALGRLVFTAEPNANGAAYTTFTFQVRDDGGTVGGGIDLDASPNTLTINVTAVNDAPLLAAANNLNPIDEDPASNSGTLVAALIAGHLSDADSAAASGIAVTAVANTDGTWEYTTDSGGAWNAFGTPSASVARLLAANPATSVRFVPTANWNGVVAGGLSLRAWDQTSGSAGATADTSTSGGGSAFSSAIASAGITVNPVNDAPAGTNQTVTTNEDTGYAFVAADFGLTDANDTPANTLGAVRISTLPGAGTLTNNGAAVSSGQSITVADINLGRLVYTPGLDASGSAYASFTFRVQDDGGSASGGVNLAPSANSMIINVSAIDDAPVNSVPAAQGTAYNTPLVFSNANGNRISLADADAGGASIQVALGATNGTLALAGVAGLTFTAGANASASMTISGSLTDINTALAVLSFTPTTNFSGAAAISIDSDDLGNSGAGGPKNDSDSVAVTINPSTVLVIDGDAFTASEDVILNAASVLANDSDPALGVLTVSAVNGNGAAVNGTLTLASGALLSMRTDGSFTYDPNGAFESLAQGATTRDSFSYTASSSAGGTGAGTVLITINGNNDAPLLAGANDLNSIDEDLTGDNGTLVSALIAAWHSDIDGTVGAGIAVTAVDNSNGSWQYTVNNGGTWSAFGTPGVANARLLAAAANTSVRFVPNANWNGSVAGGITLRAWDQSSGSAGGTADTTGNGGISAFSSASASAGITVVAVNDAPAGTSNSIATNEDTAFIFNAADFGFGDANDSPANALAALRISTLPGVGTLANNGIPVSSGQSITAADIAAGRLAFTPDANTSGAAYAAFTFQVQDDGGSANGGLDLDASPGSIAINVAAVNDAPAGTSRSVATNEDTALVFSAADFGFGDASDSPANALAAVRIGTLAGAGTLTNNGTPVGAGQSITAADLAAGRLVFTPGANASGAGYAWFTFQVQDNGGVANAGFDLDASPDTITINVTALNDAPAGVDRSVSLLEDATYTFGAADFVFADAADSPANAWLALRIAALPAAGALTLNGAPVVGGQSISAADIVAGLLLFTPAPDANGNAYASFTFQMRDDGGTAGGGSDSDASPNTIRFNVTAVNDAPAGVDRSVSLLEDATYTFGAADFVFADAADSPANAWLALRIAALPAAGALTLNGAPVVGGQSISAADIVAGLLLFTPAPDANGNAYASFTFQMRDDGGTAGGGSDSDASPNTIRFNVTAVNDAPTGSDRSLNIPPGSVHWFGPADFGLTDTRDTPADTLATVSIDSLPTSGTLTLAGAPVSAGQVVAAADIAAARLAFNAADTGTVAFSFRVQDSGGTANGGVDRDATAHTLQLVVATPGVSAPALAPIADGTPADSGASVPPAAAQVPNAAATRAPAVTAAPTSGAPAATTSRSAAATLATEDASATDASGAGLADAAAPGAASRAAAGIEAATAVAADLRALGTLSGERRGFAFESATLVDAILASGNRTELSRASYDQLLTSLRSQSFIEELDRVREDAKHEFDLEKSFAVTATGVTFGLSVAYVLWLVRSGVLLGSLLSSLPAWRVLDPLPVLARAGDSADDDDDDDMADAAPDQADDARQTLRGY